MRGFEGSGGENDFPVYVNGGMNIWAVFQGWEEFNSCNGLVVEKHSCTYGFRDDGQVRQVNG